MDRIRIKGGRPLNGTIPISGAKNATLPLMIASLLTDDTLVLENVPRLADVGQLQHILSNHGVDIMVKGKRPGDEDYRDKKGNVSCHVNFTPAYDPAVYEDLQLFMPYEALNMESGETYDLKFYLALYDKEGGRFFGKSDWYKFKLTMP